MSKVLIGYTGFVGSNLLEQDNYDVLINSKNCDELRNKHFDRIVCAGVSAVKWKANKFPEEDLANINKLIDVLSTVTTDKFVLISTKLEVSYLNDFTYSALLFKPDTALKGYKTKSKCVNSFGSIII